LLESIEFNPSWRWAAYGKHPVVRDYFWLGEKFPLGNGFSEWVENGYRRLTSKRDSMTDHYSWRFWARGPKRGVLACGILRDSSDRIGRPYPLLIMGMGPLKGWEDQWDLLPYACEKTWDHIEYLSSIMVNDFKKLEAEIHNIRSPNPEWEELRRQRGDLEEGEKHPTTVSGRPEGFVLLEQGSSHDQFNQICLYHLLFKKGGKGIPHILFMGGNLEETSLVFYQRPLIPDDFVQLWSLSFTGIENGSLTAG